MFFTNVDNTVSGSGQLGAGQMTLVNQGTIVATGDSALIIDTGTNVVTNSGTLEATGSGGLDVDSGVDNSSSLWANGGNITLHGDATGARSATISGTATLEFGGLFSGDVLFDVNGDGTLKLDVLAGFTGSVSGFVAGSDTIDLSTIDANAGVASDQAFAFAGNNAGTVANSVTWFESGGNTILQIDNTGDTTADMQII